MPKALFASKRNLVHGLLQEDIPHAVFARQVDISERQMHHIKHNLVNYETTEQSKKSQQRRPPKITDGMAEVHSHYEIIADVISYRSFLNI